MSNSKNTGEYDLHLFLIIFVLMLALFGMHSIKKSVDRIEERVFILGCTDSGKVSREVCAEEFKKQQEKK